MSKKEASMELVVKSNRLNTAIQNLSLAEIRLIQLGIIDSREQNRGLSADVPLRIEAMRYAEAFGTSKQTAYEMLIDAETNLFERRFSFIDDRDNKVKSRWISQATYIKGEGAIEIIFTPAVVNEITRIDGIEQFFTKYTLEQTAQLVSVYSVRLYELLIQWRETKKTPLFDLEILRGQLGLTISEYKRMSDFKRRVLEPAVKEINDKTDIKIEYSQEKRGRLIIGFKFKVIPKSKEKNNKKEKNIRDSDTLDMFTALKMTDKQRGTFAAKLAQMSELSDRAKQGEDYKQFAARIELELLDESKQGFYFPYLKKIGFQQS